MRCTIAIGPSSSSRPGRRQASSRRGGARHVVVHRMSGVGAFIPGRPRHISPLARRITPTMWLFGVSPQLLLRDFPRHTRGHAPSGEGARGDALELTGLGQSVEAMPRETLCAQIVVAQQVGQRHEVRHHLRSAESVTDTAHLLWSLLTSIASTDVVAMAARDGDLHSRSVWTQTAHDRGMGDRITSMNGQWATPGAVVRIRRGVTLHAWGFTRHFEEVPPPGRADPPAPAESTAATVKASPTLPSTAPADAPATSATSLTFSTGLPEGPDGVPHPVAGSE